MKTYEADLNITEYFMVTAPRDFIQGWIAAQKKIVERQGGRQVALIRHVVDGPFMKLTFKGEVPE
jgi:hypothetical protein